ncbi:hypothetical protein [Bounagaea algeriensis]
MRAPRSTRNRRTTARHLAVVTTLSVVCAMLGAPAAAAQSAPPTTPVPDPADPDQPPASEPRPQPPVLGEAGAMLGGVRILPRTITPDTILGDPDFEETLPKQSVAEVGLGVTNAVANSEAFLAQERAKARAEPLAAGLFGRSPHLPGTAFQAAVPDNAQPAVTGLRMPEQARGGVDATGLSGRAHARWSEQRGPCVDPIADARLSLAQAAAVNELPAPQDADPQLKNLGGLLDEPSGPLVRIPDTAHSHSTVRLVDDPEVAGKAVRSTSRIGLGSFQLFAGTAREIGVDVVHQPELSVTAPGDPRKSTVDYEAPVLRISRGGEEIATLDAANPSVQLPIGPVPRSERDLPPLDLGILRLSIGELRKGVLGDGQTAAAAKLLDLRVLPHLPTDRAALAQVTIGEQTVRAKAPQGGVRCEDTAGSPSGGNAPTPAPTADADGGAGGAEQRGAANSPAGDGNSTPPGAVPEPGVAQKSRATQEAAQEAGDVGETGTAAASGGVDPADAAEEVHPNGAQRDGEAGGELRPGSATEDGREQRDTTTSHAGDSGFAPTPLFWTGAVLLVLSIGLALALRPRRE